MEHSGQRRSRRGGRRRWRRKEGWQRHCGGLRLRLRLSWLRNKCWRRRRRYKSSGVGKFDAAEQPITVAVGGIKEFNNGRRCGSSQGIAAARPILE